MENKLLKRIIIFVTVFMLVFSNCGYTLQVLAATDGITLFGFNLFGSGNIDFDVYFLDENGEKQTERISDVNSQMTMVLEFTPKADGYLKSGTVKAVGNSEEGANFKIDEVFLESELVTDGLTIDTPVDNDLLKGELVVEAENSKEETTENIIDNEVSNVVSDELVDEEAALNEENVSLDNSSSSVVKATIEADNEIKVENIIENTKIYVNISFQTGEKLNSEDLCKEISFNFEGNYITYSLEEIPVSASKNVKVVWEYTKDVEVTSNYTKVSPFKIGEKEGTILENTISIKRDIIDENYLPLKETKIVLNVPTLSGNKPNALDVSALKLKATKGEDVNGVTFSNNNWEYDSANNTLTITVNNNDGTFTYGEDIYVITLRYDSYVDEAEVSLSTNGTVYVTEFSGKDNHEIVKTLDENQKVVANVGELITYSIGTTEEKICKGKINANYNSEEEKYESEFDTTVNVNILTKDVLSEFALKDTKEFYIDKDGLEFETNDIKYRKIKFKYQEIQNFLQQGGNIEIKNNFGELIYILNNDLVKSEEDAEISISGDVRGIEISFKNITVNGNISIEFTKAIGKSTYDKSVFASFQKLESRITGTVKYSEDSEGTDLEQIKTQKEFESSKTIAEITMNKLSLSTTELNENVEFKIELNNDKENSDLYVNPIFELCLPKYVDNIDLKAVNMLYESGLSIENSTIYRAEDGTLRMRIEVNGTQTEFSEGSIANGTNIIINANIELNKYAPRKDEQVKLYYINEGVTNYVSQTKWTIEKEIPTGILKTTNGFDSYVFKINAPSGFVTVNEIQNYDGENSTVSSLKQGTEIREIAMGKDAQVAKMNLVAINNTENKCTDVTFLGRVPAQGITDVKTSEILETNIDTTMISLIIENEENPLSAKIYYSENPNADKNLNDSSNGWTEEIDNLSSVKSFLIVPDDIVEPGYTFRYSYEFMIPENLPFESKIYGSFGVFYNNHSNIAVTYESSSADLVGIVTKSGPKVEATLSVNVGDGAEVQEASFLDYTLTVVNSGSDIAEGIKVTNPIPKGTTLYTEQLIEGTLNYGWYSSDKTELTWEIEKLEPGEIKEFKYTLKINIDSNIDTIKNKAVIHIDSFSLDIECNETKNKVVKSNFDIETYDRSSASIFAGQSFELVACIKNISGKNLKNVSIEYELPEELTYKSYEVFENKEEITPINLDNFNYDEERNIFTLKVSDWKEDQEFFVIIYTDLIRGNNEKVKNMVTVTTEDGKKQASKPIEMIFKGPKFEVSQVCSVAGNTIKEGENVEFVFSIQNTGSDDASDTSIYALVSENLEDIEVEKTGSSSGDLSLSANNELISSIYSIPEGENVNIHISGKVKDVDDDSKKIVSKMSISNKYTDEITTDEIVLQILNDPEKKVEEENTEPENDNNIINPSDTNENSINEVENKIYNENQAQTTETEEKTEENTQEEPKNNNTDNTIQDQNNNLDNNIIEPENTIVQNNENTQSTEVQAEKKYDVSGKIWFDANKNGILDENETGISGVQIQLQKDNMSIKATISGTDGAYTFRDVESGRYTIVYVYDNNLYTVTVYKNEESGSERASYARSLNDGKAVTDIIEVGNGNIENINLGLRDKDKFDLTIQKNINLAKIRNFSKGLRKDNSRITLSNYCKK